MMKKNLAGGLAGSAILLALLLMAAPVDQPPTMNRKNR